MRSSGSQTPRLEPAWRYGLVGGLASIPLTVGLYWLSETANELSLNMIFVGGLVAGYLAALGAERVGAEQVGATPVGIRTGVVGSLPGLWFVVDTYLFTATVGGPLWFRTLGLGMMLVTVTVMAALISIVAGVLGAKVGAWLATKLGRPADAVGS